MRSIILAYTSARQRLLCSFMDTRLGLCHTGNVENKLVIMVFVFPHKSVYSFNSGSSFSAHVAVWLAHISGTNINNVLMSFCQVFFSFTFLKWMNEQQEMAKWLKIHRAAFQHLSAGWFRSAQFVHSRGLAPLPSAGNTGVVVHHERVWKGKLYGCRAGLFISGTKHLRQTHDAWKKSGWSFLWYL